MQILIIGGSGSGKSAVAEELLEGMDSTNKYYLATMQPLGEEAEKRITKHRLLRAEKGFLTIEKYIGLAQLKLPCHGSILLECMGNLLANEMYMEGGAATQPVEAIQAGIAALKDQSENLIIVSNDVGRDGILYDHETTRYQYLLAKENKRLAHDCDIVIETVCSIARILKGEALCPSSIHLC